MIFQKSWPMNCEFLYIFESLAPYITVNQDPTYLNLKHNVLRRCFIFLLAVYNTGEGKQVNRTIAFLIRMPQTSCNIVAFHARILTS